MQQAVGTNCETQYILRRCTSCKSLNRVVLTMALFARCGTCGRELHLSYYDVLGLSPTATPEDVRKSYHYQVLMWHPDKRPGDTRSAVTFQTILSAYRTLANPESRERYNRLQVPAVHVHVEPSPYSQSQCADDGETKGDSQREGSTGTRSRETPPSQAQTDKNPTGAARETSPLVHLSLRFAVIVVLLAVIVIGWLMTGPHVSAAGTAAFLSITMGLAASGIALVVFSLVSLGTRDGT